MTSQVTIDKLIEMKLTSMADAFRIQENDPSMKELSFEDRFGMLVDNEYTSRKNNRLKRLIKNSSFETLILSAFIMAFMLKTSSSCTIPTL